MSHNGMDESQRIQYKEKLDNDNADKDKLSILDDYFKLQEEIYKYFGYVEDWVVIPLDDARMYYWTIAGGEGYGGEVQYAKTIEQLNDEDGDDLYASEIYTQRFLPKWVYRGEAFTMICVDTQIDGNKFLQIFDNRKEVKD